MKKYISILAAAFAALTAAFSCTEPEETIEPNFPEAVTIQAEPGQDVEIQINPNQVWSVSLPVSQSKYFWIKDQESDEKLYTMNGKEGEYVIVVGVADVLDNEEHSAELTMKMGDKSQVIATIHLGSLPEANFPEPETVTVEPGSKNTFEIDPNQSWTLSIPSSDTGSEFFWFENGEEKAFSLKGEAGKHTITLAVADKKDMEEHKVDVTMTMRGESQVIRTFVLEADEPVFELCLANCNETSFEGGSDGFTYAYGEPLPENSEIDLVWPTVSSCYLHNIRVRSNYSWEVRTDAEWLSITEAANMNKIGEYTEFQIFTNPETYPSEAASAELVFSDPAGKLADRTYTVNFPSLENLMKFGGRIAKGSEILFNKDGLYYLNGYFIEGAQATGTATSLTEAKIYYIEELGGYFAAKDATKALGMNSWINVSYDWNKGTGVLLKKVNYTVTVSQNTNADERKAMLIALPSGMLPADFNPNMDLFNSEHNALNPEYEDYVFATVRQEGASGSQEEGLEISFPDGMGEVEGDKADGKYFKFENMAELEDPYSDPDVAEFGPVLEMGGHAYRISFWDPMMSSPDAGFYLEMAGSYISHQVSYSAQSWLSAEVQDNGEGNELHLNMGDAANGSKGYVYFYDASGNCVCILICVKGY